MKSNFSVAVIIFSAISFVSGVCAQQKNPGFPGTDAPLYKQIDKETRNPCYVYKNFVVKSVVSEEDTGDDIIIFKRNEAEDFRKNCARNRHQAYMTQVSTDNSGFYGLINNLFFVDNGTSAGERGLDIVSLTSKKVVYSTGYYNQPKIVGNTLIYDKPSDKKGSLKVCPEALKWRKTAGGEGWVQPTRLDLTTFRETRAGNLKCVYLE